MIACLRFRRYNEEFARPDGAEISNSLAGSKKIGSKAHNHKALAGSKKSKVLASMRPLVQNFCFFELAKELAIFWSTPPCKNTGRLKKTIISKGPSHKTLAGSKKTTKPNVLGSMRALGDA